MLQIRNFSIKCFLISNILGIILENKIVLFFIISFRLKRDTKLTPADMLALVALVEAGERARKDTDTDAGYTMYPSENYVPKAYGINNNYNTGLYDYPAMGPAAAVPQNDDSLDYNNGGWFEPQSMVDYYGVPMNMEPMPKYEIPPQRENKYNDRK